MVERNRARFADNLGCFDYMDQLGHIGGIEPAKRQHSLVTHVETSSRNTGEEAPYRLLKTSLSREKGSTAENSSGIMGIRICGDWANTSSSGKRRRNCYEGIKGSR